MGNSTFCLILDFEAARLFVLRASSGILAQKHDQKYELSSFYVLLFFFDDFRNYRFWFMLLRHTKKCLFVATLFYYFFNGSSLTLYSICSLLRSAQISHGSLRPAYPGSPTCCTCGYSSSSFRVANLYRNIPHSEYCPAHDVYDTERSCMPLSLSLYPQSSTLAYSQAIESRADLTGNGETRETGKKAR